MEALRSILKFESSEVPLVIFTHSIWSAKAFSVWLSVWMAQGWINNEEKPVVHQQKWLHIAEMVLARTGPTEIMHIKGQSKKNTEEAHWNNLMDALAKEAALEDPPKDLADSSVSI